LNHCSKHPAQEVDRAIDYHCPLPQDIYIPLLTPLFPVHPTLPLFPPSHNNRTNYRSIKFRSRERLIMEPSCTTKTTFYHPCAHVHVDVTHADSCPESTCCTSPGCAGMSVRTFILNSLCPWCTGEEAFRAPQHTKSRKEQLRGEFERVVRMQIVECEAKASAPKEKRVGCGERKETIK